MSRPLPPTPAPDALRTEPVSRLFGLDLGRSICRHYLERFLSAQADAIRGRVLEIGDNAYTLRFGRDVTRSDVLHAVPEPGATIVGDLASGRGVPQAAFDCFILTQTVQCIYDFRAALKNACLALKPGGALLVSASGISQISRYDMDRWGEFWRFTDLGLRRALEEACPGAEIEVFSYGNLAAAKAYLDGLPAESFDPALLDREDADYQLVLAARLTRPEDDTPLLVPTPAPDGWLELAVPDDLAGLAEFAATAGPGPWRVRFRGLVIHCADLAAFAAEARNVFLRGLYDFPAPVAHPVVLDCGAGLGLLALRAKALHPGARIAALESRPAEGLLFQLNVRANIRDGGLDDVELLPDGPEALPGLLRQGVDLLRLRAPEGAAPLLAACGPRLRRVARLVVDAPDADAARGVLESLGFSCASDEASGPLLAENPRPTAVAAVAAAPGAKHDPDLAANLCVVLRGVGERSTEACLELLARELPGENIALVCERPFARAVRATCERGLALGRPWVLALDADMLLRPGALADMLAQARAVPEDVFCLWPMALDKALLVYRPVGIHLYRASALGRALALLAQDCGEANLRPETALVNRMLAGGMRAAQTDVLAGLHDHGQAWADLAKKGFLHARKHRDFVTQLLPRWERLAGADPDYRALAAGARLGLLHEGVVVVDHLRLAELTRGALDGLDLPDQPGQPPLPSGAALTAFVAGRLDAAKTDPDRLELQPRIFPEHFWRRIDAGVV